MGTRGQIFEKNGDKVGENLLFGGKYGMMEENGSSPWLIKGRRVIQDEEGIWTRESTVCTYTGPEAAVLRGTS